MRVLANLSFRMLAIGLIAFSLALILRVCGHNPLSWHGEWAQHIEKRAARLQMPWVGIGGVRKAVASPDVCLLDARPSPAFRAGHIPSARTFPLDQAMPALAALRSEVDLNKNIITYCSNSGCDEGLELALLLRQAGYTRVSFFAGGLNEWKAAGGPVERDHDSTY